MSHNRELTYKAKKLRKNMTDAERKLWFCFLKDNPLKFYAQRVISPYIVDFYCAEIKLIVELDGDQHYGVNERVAEDIIRDENLKKQGYTVLRIDNYMVYNRFSETCDYITSVIEELKSKL